jgi:spore germination protein GerM
MPVHASVGAPEWGDYSADLSFESPPAPVDATLRAFNLSAKDGSVRDLVEVPVRLRAAAVTPAPVSATMTRIRVYFPREAPDELLFVGVTREVSKTPAIGRAALDELLRGPTSAERAQQLYAPFPADATVKSLRIENGTATVDYSASVGGAGGSARARTIIRSTELTLRQFPSVQKVVILIDGKPAALQP